MESLTYMKNIAIAPKKLRFMLKVIKRMKPADALVKLSYMHERPAQVYHKAIHSAMSNARHLLKTSDDLLEFKLLTIEEGNALKRYNPGGRGTAKPYKRRFSHIKIILTAKETPKIVEKKEVKAEVKKVAKSKTK